MFVILARVESVCIIFVNDLDSFSIFFQISLFAGFRLSCAEASLNPNEPQGGCSANQQGSSCPIALGIASWAFSLEAPTMVGFIPGVDTRG